jgi:hypothetical protein
MSALPECRYGARCKFVGHNLIDTKARRHMASFSHPTPQKSVPAEKEESSVLFAEIAAVAAQRPVPAGADGKAAAPYSAMAAIAVGVDTGSVRPCCPNDGLPRGCLVDRKADPEHFDVYNHVCPYDTVKKKGRGCTQQANP